MVADGDAAQPFARARPRLAIGVPAGHLAIEVELVRELDVEIGIGNVAAGRDVEIVQLDAARQSGDGVPAIGIVAPLPAQALGHRHARESVVLAVTVAVVADGLAEELEAAIRHGRSAVPELRQLERATDEARLEIAQALAP